MNSSCPSEDGCSDSDVGYFDLIDPSAANAELNSQAREIATGTYRYVRLEFGAGNLSIGSLEASDSALSRLSFDGPSNLRPQAATQQDGHVLGGARIVLGLAPMDRFPLEGMAQDQRPHCLRTQIGQPGPREDPFDGDDPLVPRGCDGLAERFGSGLHVAVQHDLAVLVEQTEGHGAGRQVDAAV